MEKRIGDFIDKFWDVADLATLEGTFSAQVADLGFEKFTYVGSHGSEPIGKGQHKPIVMTTFPESWARRYSEEGYHRYDPVMMEASRSILPLQWSELTGRRLPGLQRQVMAEAADHGLTNGFTIPVHGHGGEFGVVSLTAACSAEEFSERVQQARFQLHMVTLYYHTIVGRNFIVQPDLAAISLTPRETECLLWTAQGKTAWEISQILHLSVWTIRGYLRSAMNKMGVVSKHQAVAKGILLGLIRP